MPKTPAKKLDKIREANQTKLEQMLIDMLEEIHVYKVVFLNEKGERVEKVFESPYLARKFVNKINHSKRCQLISAPLV